MYKHTITFTNGKLFEFVCVEENLSVHNCDGFVFYKFNDSGTDYIIPVANILLYTVKKM
jgi:hypothetical protein